MAASLGTSARLPAAVRPTPASLTSNPEVTTSSQFTIILYLCGETRPLCSFSLLWGSWNPPMENHDLLCMLLDCGVHSSLDYYFLLWGFSKNQKFHFFFVFNLVSSKSTHWWAFCAILQLCSNKRGEKNWFSRGGLIAGRRQILLRRPSASDTVCEK